MTNKLPIKALRTFDVAARHTSLTEAAEVLNVTHGAVSRQVQQLEDYLGRSLFRRLPRGVELTPDGRKFALRIRGAFNEISQAVEGIRVTDEDHGKLTISTLPGLASRWLFPRLPGFQKRYPEYKVQVSIKARLVDFQSEGIDLAIRYGGGDWENVFTQRLFGEEMFPVCAPSLVAGPDGLKEPGDLVRFPLLHHNSERYWATWLKQAGMKDVAGHQGQTIDDINVLLQACIAGQGVALGLQPLVQADLEAGRLVRPFSFVLPSDVAFYAVCPKGANKTPKIKAMIDWLVEEADATRTAR